MPDATGLELVAAEVRDVLGDDAVVGTQYYRDKATLEVQPARIGDVVEFLMHTAKEPYDFLSSVHGCDYFPDEPRLGIHYQLVARARTDRLNVKTRVTAEDPTIPTVTHVFPGAMFDERETYDMFGVIFDGHPDLRRILLPEDWQGHALRKDFPLRGYEPYSLT